MIEELRRLANERDVSGLMQLILALDRGGALRLVAIGWDRGFFNDVEFCDTALQVLDWEIGETLPCLAPDQSIKNIP